MPKRTMSQGILLAILLICLAVLGTLLTLLSPTQPQSEPLANRSIYNSDVSGYRAWYLTNKKAGIPMRPWEKSFANLAALPAPATMLMVEPYTVAKTSIIFGKKEAAMLLAWVSEGNTLVLLDDFRRYGSNSIAYDLALQVKRTYNRQSSSVSHPRGQANSPTPDPAAQPLTRITTLKALGNYVHLPIVSRSGLSFQQEKFHAFPSQTLLADAKNNPVLIRIPYEKGVLIVGTALDLGDNAYLHNPANDNYQYLSNLLVHEKNPIFINEFVHGYAESEDIFSYYQQKTPLGAIFGQLFLALIFLVWLSIVRWTPKPTEEDATAQQPTETSNGLHMYIQSLAGIYYRTQSASLAIAPQLDRIERLLRQRFRLSLDEESRLHHLLGSIFADYSNKEDEMGNQPDALLNILKRARTLVEKQERLPHPTLLKLTRQLTIIEERLQQHGTRIHSSQR